MHWIHWKQCEREGDAGIAGRLIEVKDDGWFVVELGGDAGRWWNHDPQRLRVLMEQIGGDVVVVPGLHALVVEDAWVNYTSSLSTACRPRQVWTSR
jgi:hypothetical protein